jgi:hypothetical protein
MTTIAPSIPNQATDLLERLRGGLQGWPDPLSLVRLL